MLNDGRYSLIYPSGDYRTLRVKTPKDGKSLAGKTILSIKEGKNYIGVGFLTDSGKVNFWNRTKESNPPERLQRIQLAVDRIVKDPEAAGLAFAMKENACYRCGRVLTVPASVHKGMGPECAKVGNWTKEDQKKVYRAKALGRIQEQDRPGSNLDQDWTEQKELFAEWERKQEERAVLLGP